MSHKIFYPDLKIIPLSHIKMQELVRKDRYHTLAQTIKKEKILRNPPLVTSFGDGKYLHLDGANRITVLQMLGYKRCLVQEVDYGDTTQVRLLSWSHVTKVRKKSFLLALDEISMLKVTPVSVYNHTTILKPLVVAIMMFADGSVYVLSCRGTLAQRGRVLTEVVNCYGDIIRVFSQSSWNWSSIQKRFQLNPGSNLFIQFPTFSPSQVMQMVSQGIQLPAGITRHVVYRRKLNVNLPLSYLKIASIAQANKKLQKHLQHKTVRLYEEPVIYFE